MSYVPSRSRNMPGVKRTPGRGRRTPLKYSKKVAAASKSYVQRAIVGAKQIKSFGVSVTLTGASGIPNTGTMTALTAITQGTGDYQRIGDTIHFQRLAGRYYMYPGTTGEIPLVRMIFFQWHPDGSLTTPVPADILDSVDILKPVNWDKRNQFTIISDKTLAVHGPSTNGVTFGNFDLAIPRKRSQFTGVVTASNQVYLMCISNDSSTPYPTLDMRVSTTYFD